MGNQLLYSHQYIWIRTTRLLSDNKRLKSFIAVNQSKEKHICKSSIVGHQIIFECDQCDYKRVLDLRNGKSEVIVKNDDALHSGMMINPHFLINEN